VAWPGSAGLKDAEQQTLTGGFTADGNRGPHRTDGPAESGEGEEQGDVLWSCHASYGKAVRQPDFGVALITCSYLHWAFLALILFKEE